MYRVYLRACRLEDLAPVCCYTLGGCIDEGAAMSADTATSAERNLTGIVRINEKIKQVVSLAFNINLLALTPWCSPARRGMPPWGLR